MSDTHEEVGTYGHLAVGCKVQPQGSKQTMVVATIAVNRDDPEDVTIYLVPSTKKAGVKEAKPERFGKSIDKLERLD